MLPGAERAEFVASLDPEEAAALMRAWRGFLARPDQLAPEGRWSTWLALAARGWGKTEAGSQWVKERIEGGARHIALVAETAKDLEEVMAPRLAALWEGSEAPTMRFRPTRLVWPNGAVALGYNGTEPDQLRGPEFDTAWVDELAKYRRAQETWDMLRFTMRKGDDPRVMVTTTPRPILLIRKLLKDKRTVVTRGRTKDNASNLPREFLDDIQERYAGTRLGRQELEGELLEDVPGALWTESMFDRVEEVPECSRIVVGVDPSGASGEVGENADAIGIVVAGRTMDGRYVVLEDATCSLSPAGWGRRAVDCYKRWRADRIVAERNFGGAMVEAVIRGADRNAPVKMVTASRGKAVRAEPIAALYEQKKVAHVRGLDQLEAQMMATVSTGYVGEGSPDRLDAAVWALSELSDAGGVAMRMKVRY